MGCRHGQPLIVKVVTSEAERNSEKLMIETMALKLHNMPSVSLVPAQVEEIVVEGTYGPVKGHTCIISPLYSTTVAKLQHVLTVDTLIVGGFKIRATLEEVHRHGLVHMDVKPSNIVVDHDGKWLLGDYGSCVKIGQNIHSCSHPYLPVNVLKRKTMTHPGFDFFMLASSLVSLATDLIQIVRIDERLTDVEKLKNCLCSVQNGEFQVFVTELLEEYDKFCKENKCQ